MIQRIVLLGIVSVSLLGIGPYVSFFSKPSLISSKEIVQQKGIFDEIAEVGEKVGDIDEEVENVRRAGEEFIDDVKEEE